MGEGQDSGRGGTHGSAEDDGQRPPLVLKFGFRAHWDARLGNMNRLRQGLETLLGGKHRAG